ncbi:MAG: chemotaxis response regulator protein-glutamate methylesterase [Deltaproteobacteria bacterium]|nr:chemotaxis response regulator protein-glutamate methylesterase [Deltaproteobacteria bacterium]
MALNSSKIGVLICDDSALMRRALRKIIESDPDLYVAGTARDGEDAVAKARELQPDVVTMDINMPSMDGITALQIIVDEGIAPVLMVSSLTQEGAVATFEALALGAFDYVSKPGGTVSHSMEPVSIELIRKLKAATRKGTMKKLARKGPDMQRGSTGSRERPRRRRVSASRGPGPGFKAVAIGASTGGPKTIFDVLPFLPADLDAAVFMVQHMPPAFTRSFAERIDANCPLPCVEAEPGTVVEQGRIYLAKGGFHMTLFKKLTGKVVLRTTTRPKHPFMPSVDVMMKSVLEVFGSDTIGVLMTGMGDDGAEAMVEIARAGSVTIAESEDSAIVYGMPREAIKRGGARVVVPSWEIAEEIVKAIDD